MILPRPDDAFEWRETSHGPALVCLPLEPLAPHLFTSAAWRLGRQAPGDSAAWSDVPAALGAASAALVRLQQLHGREAVVAEQIAHPQDTLPGADIIVSANPDSVVAVQAADCVPLLIADRRLGVVAAAHAGWRGLAAGVPRVAVETLARVYGSSPGDLVAALGPSIAACCYEVGPDVRAAFVSAGFGSPMIERWFTASAVHVEGNPSMPGLPAARTGHEYFDGWSSARDQLLTVGVSPSHIHSARLCTASHADVLCSFRRDGRAAGRMAGAIRPARRS